MTTTNYESKRNEGLRFDIEAKKSIYIDLENSLYNIIPTVNKFKGNKITKRIASGIQTALPNNDVTYFIDRKSIRIYPNRNVNKGKISPYNGREFNASNFYEEFILQMDANGRFDVDGTISVISGHAKGYRKAIEDYTNALNNFDKYIHLNAKIQSEIDEYYKTIPACMRINILVNTDY